jgi:16S rRNA G966 N2-methylase RsmD
MSMSKDWKNQINFGDNFDILKQLYEEDPKKYFDLIYIDPPFNQIEIIDSNTISFTHF